MADNLTVKSGSPKAAEPKADKAESREQTELNRLRTIAKKHHGKWYAEVTKGKE